MDEVFCMFSLIAMLGLFVLLSDTNDAQFFLFFLTFSIIVLGANAIIDVSVR